MQQRFTYSKAERLTRQKIIEQLFQKGAAFSFNEFPLKMLVLPTPLSGPYPAQVLIVVSKRAFKKAHDRNRVKRLIRETWRVNKHIVYEHLKHNGLTAAIMLSWNSNVEPGYIEVYEKLHRAIEKFKVYKLDKKVPGDKATKEETPGTSQ